MDSLYIAGSTSHAVYRGVVAGKVQQVTVACSSEGDDIKRGTLASMIRQSGLPKKELCPLTELALCHGLGPTIVGVSMTCPLLECRDPTLVKEQCLELGRVMADPHSRSATSNVDAGNEDRTSVTMRQSRPRPDINAPITAPRPPLCCSHPERRRNHRRVPLLRHGNLFRAHFRSGLASAVGNQPDRFDLIDTHQAVTFPIVRHRQCRAAQLNDLIGPAAHGR